MPDEHEQWIEQWDHDNLEAFTMALVRLKEIRGSRVVEARLGEAGHDTLQAIEDAYLALSWLAEPTRTKVQVFWKPAYRLRKEQRAQSQE